MSLAPRVVVLHKPLTIHPNPSLLSTAIHQTNPQHPISVIFRYLLGLTPQPIHLQIFPIQKVSLSFSGIITLQPSATFQYIRLLKIYSLIQSGCIQLIKSDSKNIFLSNELNFLFIQNFWEKKICLPEKRFSTLIKKCFVSTKLTSEGSCDT